MLRLKVQLYLFIVTNETLTPNMALIQPIVGEFVQAKAGELKPSAPIVIKEAFCLSYQVSK